MEVTGILKVKFDTQKVSDRFSKREFVLTTEATSPYPQHVSFQLTQDKCNLLDQYNVGDEMKIQFNLRGREWNGPQGVKYFNTLEAWRIEKAGQGQGIPQSGPSAMSLDPIPAPAATTSLASDEEDDLPF